MLDNVSYDNLPAKRVTPALAVLIIEPPWNVG